MKVCTPARNASDVEREVNPGLPACATVDAERSMPAQNASPSPVINSARTFASFRMLRMASTSASRISTVSAFFACGRLSTIRPTPSVSISTSSSLTVMTRGS